METPIGKTIDLAIENCEKNICDHKTKSQTFLRWGAFFVALFIILISFIVFSHYYNQNRIESSISEARFLSGKIEKEIKRALEVVNYLKMNHESYSQHYSQNNSPSNYIIAQDSIAKLYYETSFLSDVSDSIKSLPNRLSTSIITIGYPIQYAIAVFFVIFISITTSFYRFHLNEVSKYEQFMFGLYRIRIAANNSNTGFEDEVRISLARDAFSVDNKFSLLRREKKIESPIPGHPTTEFLTAILNKVLEGVEISSKKKM